MLRYHIVSHTPDRTSAHALVQRVYRRDGYVNDSESSVIGQYLLCETTTVFCVSHEDDLIGTISLVHGKHSSFPMDVIFKSEIDALMVPRAQMGEVCQFAIDKEILTQEQHARLNDMDISIGLLGCVLSYGLKHNFEGFCLSVNPKHARFYESLGCVSIGAEKQYPSVNNAPARAYYLDIRQFTGNIPAHNWIMREIMRRDYRTALA